MAIQKLTIEDFVAVANTGIVIDVRSPSEFEHAHIPNAFSLPLFNDEERAIVGTTYKQKSREQAIKIALPFFGNKMLPMVESSQPGTTMGKFLSAAASIQLFLGSIS